MYIINLKIVYSYICIQRVNSIYIITRHASTFSSTNPKSKSLINSKEKFPGFNKWILSSLLPSIAQIILYFVWILFGSDFPVQFLFFFQTWNHPSFLVETRKMLAIFSLFLILSVAQNFFFFFWKTFFPRVQRSPILIWAEILPRPCGYSYIQSVVASSPSFHSRYRFFKKGDCSCLPSFRI